MGFRRRSALVLLALATGAVAQTTVGTPTTTPPSGTSTVGGPTGTGAADPAESVHISLPPLLTCQVSTWAFSNAPPGLPKYLGFFVTGTTDFLETYTLPETYTPLANGTFNWLCDFPVGLSVAAMFYAQDPATGQLLETNHASTPSTVVAAGTSDACLALNAGQNTNSIISYASSLDPNFRASTLPVATQTGNSNKEGGGGVNAGAIAGGVAGGLTFILALVILFFYLRHRRAEDRQWANDSVYGGPTSEKFGPPSTFGHGLGPAGNYIPYDEYGRPLNAAEVYGPPPAAVEAPPVSRAMAAPGTLPEPMDADSEARRTVHTPDNSAHSPPPGTATSPFAPMTEGESMRSPGTEGLDDPSTFSPLRATYQRGSDRDELDDPSSFAGRERPPV